MKTLKIKINEQKAKGQERSYGMALVWNLALKVQVRPQLGVGRKQSTWQLASTPTARLLGFLACPPPCWGRDHTDSIQAVASPPPVCRTFQRD